ncbi:hypothetical protein ACI3PF_20610, partial [Lactococcus lactis]
MLSFVSTFSTFGSDLASTFGSAFLTGSLALGFSVTTGCSVDATSTFAAFSASSLALILAKVAEKPVKKSQPKAAESAKKNKED